MADLITAVGQDLTGHSVPPGPGRSLLGNLEVLVATLGSLRAAGRYLGIGESTLRGWRKGVTPRRDPGVVAQAARAAAVAQRGVYRDAFRGHKTLSIIGQITVSSDSRIRTVHPGRFIPTGTIQRILRTWAAGDDARAEASLYRAIDRYYQPLRFDNIIQAWFE